MILGPITLIDCLVFVVFLAPQLLMQIGLLPVLSVACQTIPFLLFVLPRQLIYERYFQTTQYQSPFVRNATLFEDLVIRCVRFAFARIPARVGRVFFSKGVVLPFLRFRMLRHGYLSSPIYYKEITRRNTKGVWAIHNPDADVDVIIYYCHGGGFSMGSAYFYLEFLMAWTTCLKNRGFKNPAIFAVDYTLVPDAQWPKQFAEVQAGYKFLIDSFGHDIARKICVSGDSAGATLILSLLLHPGNLEQEPAFQSFQKPGLAILISPWTHLVSDLNRNTPSDYLDKNSLHLYAKQYAGKARLSNEVISPGLGTGRWRAASPLDGYRLVYGSEEVFAPAIHETIRHMKSENVLLQQYEDGAGIHAWPVVKLFLGSSREERLKGLEIMTEYIMQSRMAPMKT